MVSDDGIPQFAARSAEGLINYWPAADEKSGDLRSDGLSRADALIAAMRDRSGQAITLKFVAQAMAASGRFGPMESAFFHRLGEHLLS